MLVFLLPSRNWWEFTNVYCWKSRTRSTTEVPRTSTRSSSHSKRGLHSFQTWSFLKGNCNCNQRVLPRQVVDLREILQPGGNSHRPAGLHVQRQRRRAHEAGGRWDASFQVWWGQSVSEGSGSRRRLQRAIDRLFCSGLVFSPRDATRTRQQAYWSSSAFPPAGMFKESKLWQVHAEGSAGGPHAASLKVPAALAGMHTNRWVCIFFSIYCTSVLLFYFLLFYLHNMFFSKWFFFYHMRILFFCSVFK